MGLEWKIVKNSWTQKPIGAIAFRDDKVAVLVAFYDDKDMNNDGKIDFSERFFSLFSMKGRALAEVASHAYADPDIAIRDPTIYNLRGELFVKFAHGLLAEGIYKAWFAFGISRIAGTIATQVKQNMIQSFLIRKGFEEAVQAAYNNAVRL